MNSQTYLNLVLECIAAASSTGVSLQFVKNFVYGRMGADDYTYDSLIAVLKEAVDAGELLQVNQAGKFIPVTDVVKTAANPTTALKVGKPCVTLLSVIALSSN